MGWPTFKLFEPLPFWPQTPSPTALLYLNAVPQAFPQNIHLTTKSQERAAVTTTVRPSVKDTEPTTKRPSVMGASRPSKLQANFNNDARLLTAVRNINTDFVIEDIVPVPGRHVYSQKSFEQAPTAKLQKSKKGNKKATQRVKVEARGQTSSSGTVPEIPYDTYFLPYLAAQSAAGGKKPASLILEPHAKAIVGNGGTAISAPISRAVLKRGTPTNVYFNPESVAIAGVGGKAHAQADLELDLLNRRR